jgi:hypothetical protein
MEGRMDKWRTEWMERRMDRRRINKIESSMNKWEYWLRRLSIIISSLGLLLSILLYSYLFGSFEFPRKYHYYPQFDSFLDAFFWSPILFTSIGVLIGFFTIYDSEKKEWDKIAALSVIIGIVGLGFTLFMYLIGAVT